MTIILHWWMIPVALFIIPLIYGMLHEDEGGYFPDMSVSFAVLVCWLAALCIIIGHFL